MVRAAAALLLASCGTASAGQAPAARDTILLKTATGLRVVDANGALVRSLGRAMPSHDGTVFYALDGPAQTLRAIDARSGDTKSTIGLPGAFRFVDEGAPAPTGLSPSGRWLVLAGEAGDGSAFAVIDTAAARVAATVALDDKFAYDAISDDGTSLYLIEPISTDKARSLIGYESPYGYRVRVYDVPSATLVPTPVVDQKLASQTTNDHAQTRVDGIMSGIYQSSVQSRDGNWNFSFYYNPSRGPFIHALHLSARFAFCILDLPTAPKGFEKRLGWSLAIAPANTTMYAANGSLGLVTAIDTETLKVKRTASLSGLPTAAETARTSAPNAIVARDGRRLYLAAERGVALIDTSDFAVRGLFLSDRVVANMALSADGRRLYAVSSEGNIAVLDATTGATIREMRVDGATAVLRVAAS